MRFFFKVQPEELTLDQFCKLECDLVYLAKIEVIPLKLK